jgi:putative aldouronate transport system permease protein
MLISKLFKPSKSRIDKSKHSMMKSISLIFMEARRIPRELWENRFLYILGLPGIIWIIIFAYLPMSGHIIAFKKYFAPKGVFGSDWLRFDQIFENFDFFFKSGQWVSVTGNTLFLNFLFIIAELFFAIIIALFLNEVRKLIVKKIAQSLILLPFFISWLAVSVMFFALFNSTNGFINQTLVSIAGENADINWYSRPEFWPALLTALHVWKTAGYSSIIFLAAISGISEELYESAKIDGANKYQQIIFVTLPLLKPTVIILLLLALGRVFFGNFEMIYSLVGENGLLFPTTNIIDTYTYRALRNLGNFGMASAVGLYQAVMGLLTILFFNWFIKKIDSEERGLF